jgi:hypothetical protein
MRRYQEHDHFNATYFPFRLQQRLLGFICSTIEEYSYYFFKKWAPKVLWDMKIKSPSSVDVKTWWQILSNISLPVEIFPVKDRQHQLKRKYDGIRELRNGFSHRAGGIQVEAFKQMFTDAKIIATDLGDTHRLEKLEVIWQKVKIVVDYVKNLELKDAIRLDQNVLLPIAEFLGLSVASTTTSEVSHSRVLLCFAFSRSGIWQHRQRWRQILVIRTVELEKHQPM